MKNKFIMTAAIVTAMTMVTPSLASAAEIQPIASETEAPAETEAPSETEAPAETEAPGELPERENHLSDLFLHVCFIES